MDKMFGAMLITLVLATSGCRFDTSGLPVSLDAGNTDSLSDASQEDVLADVGKTDSHHDIQPSDTIREDAQSDALQQDSSLGPCQTVPQCNGHGTCPAGTCLCNAGYQGSACDSVVAPTITNLTVGCTNDCIGGTKYDVTWTFTDAVTFSADLTWVNGNPGFVVVGSLETVSGTPISLASDVYPQPPPTYPLPTATAGTPTQYTIRWLMGGPLPCYLQVCITVTGPGGSRTACKVVHVVN